MISRVFLIIIGICLHFHSFSQNLAEQPLTNNSIPEFVYGDAELDSFLKNNVINPKIAEANGINCDIEISFDIDTNATVSNLNIEKNKLIVSKNFVLKNLEVEMELTKQFVLEAKRVIGFSSGLWQPAIVNGKKQSGKRIVKIKFETNRFRLNETINNTMDLMNEGLTGSYEYIDPTDPIRYYNLGVQKLQEKKYLIAIRYLEVSSQLKENVDAYYNLGIAFFKIRAIEMACENWSKAQKLGDAEVVNLINKYCGK